MAARARPALRRAATAQLIRTGRVVEHLPVVAAGFADGQITADQVSVLASVTKPENLAAAAAQGVNLAEVDVVLADTGATRRTRTWGRWCSTT